MQYVRREEHLVVNDFVEAQIFPTCSQSQDLGVQKQISIRKISLSGTYTKCHFLSVFQLVNVLL